MSKKTLLFMILGLLAVVAGITIYCLKSLSLVQEPVHFDDEFDYLDI